MKKIKIHKSLIALFLRIIGNFGGLLNTLIIIKYLTPSNYGLFRILNSSILIIFEITNAGILQTLIRTLIDGYKEKNKSYFTYYLKSVRKIIIIQNIFAFCILFLYTYFKLPVKNLFWLFFLYIILNGCLYFGGQYFISLVYSTEKIIKWFAFFTLLNSGKFLFSIIFVVILRYKLYGAMLSQFLSIFIAFLYSLLMWYEVKKKEISLFPSKFSKKFSMKFHLSYGVIHFINVEINSFLGEFTILFLNFISLPLKVIGAAGVAFSLQYMTINILSVFANYLFPKLSILASENNMEKLKQKLEIQSEISIILSWITILSFYLLGKILFLKIFPKYFLSYTLFLILGYGLVLKPIEFKFVNYTLSMKKNKYLLIKSFFQFFVIFMGFIILHILKIKNVNLYLYIYAIGDVIGILILGVFLNFKEHLDLFYPIYCSYPFFNLILYLTSNSQFWLKIIICIGIGISILLMNRKILLKNYEIFHFLRK